MLKVVIGALFACVLWCQPTFAQSTDWAKIIPNCKGEFEDRTKCMMEIMRALEGRAIVAESRLSDLEKRLVEIEKLNVEARVSALERNTLKAGQVVDIMSDFRKQCLHRLDTNSAPIFVPCNSHDPRDELFALRPR